MPWASWYGNAALAALLSDIEPDNVGNINLTSIVNIIPAAHATERARVRKFLSFLLLGLIINNRDRRIAANMDRANKITLDAQGVCVGSVFRKLAVRPESDRARACARGT